ncbi:hypothetical protein [Paraferrimonas sedimenticola]|uniref:Uncharacterized protein n=1 Tax=Paraferrimonas sedimenticola TaxID=375674 RepID=A0AA37RW50_9GAMM|nr:hypothetical protein [Paraferrimonas sedimenticola]GLP96394.1 hypothetical protein GCM10007895_17000 [Paraferrimonas sedimenticola]
MEYEVNLNGRNYLIADYGEGVCVLLVLHYLAPDKLSEYKKSLSGREYRLLSVDLSHAWPNHPLELSQSQLNDIASDLHLLADINWLDEIVFAPSTLGTHVFEILEAKLKTRVRLLNYEHQSQLET